MNRTVLFFCLSFFAACKLTAQSEYDLNQSVLEIEAQGGLTINNLHGGDFRKLDLGKFREKIGYSWGIGFNFRFLKFLSLRNEFNLDSRGVLMSLRSTLDTLNQQAQEYLDVKQRLDYMTLPLLLQLGLGRKRIRLYADVGVYLGMLWNAREEIRNTLTGQKDFASNVRAFTQIDWGILSGIGFMYHINRKISVNIKLRYNHGLQVIETGTPAYEGARNSSWSVLTAVTAKF